MEGTIELEPRLQRRPSQRWLAFGVAVFGLAMTGYALSLGIAARAAGTTFTASFVGEIGAFVFTIEVIVLGLILRSRRPDHPIGWLLLPHALTLPSADCYDPGLR